MNDKSRPIQTRRDVVAAGRLSFRKRYESVGYWMLLAIVFALIIWFISSSAADQGDASDAEATIIATLFVPETATAIAEKQADSAR